MAKQEMSFTQAIIEMFLITPQTNYITVYLLSSGFKITTLGSELIPYFQVILPISLNQQCLIR